jgi:hypothetical protein
VLKVERHMLRLHVERILTAPRIRNYRQSSGQYCRSSKTRCMSSDTSCRSSAIRAEQRHVQKAEVKTASARLH